jgi:TrmH family RNA methyltransferase
MAVITSLHNERVKLIRALQTSGKSRRKENRIVLEGVRLVNDALTAGAKPDFVLYTQDLIAGDQLGSRLFATLQDQNVTSLEVSPEVMAHAADTQSPQGLIAVVPYPEQPVPLPASVTFAIILDGVADPGNVGTILRTAAAAGVDVVILGPNCVDPYNPKVLRGGMGAHFRIPILRKSWSDIVKDYADLPMYVADSGGDKLYYDVDWRGPAAIIIGGEARGAESQAYQLAQGVISIPMANAAESLNAAVAASILLFEVRHQRATV